MKYIFDKRLFMMLLIVFVIISGILLYLFNMPGRDVGNTPVDFQLQVRELITEYLEDNAAANDKYLKEDGDSRIIAITGIVSLVDEDIKQQKVVVLRDIDRPVGVSCTFMPEHCADVEKLKAGDSVTIKGVIRSGAEYDEDSGLYEDVIMEKCSFLYGN